MARSGSFAVENNFVGGLITERTGFNFPESAVTDCLNVVFNKDGSVSRRPGIQPEADFISEGTTITAGANRGFTWEISTKEGNKKFLAFQRGNIIKFYDQTADSLSQGVKEFQVNLSSYLTRGSTNDINKTIASFASGNNHLFITMKWINPIYVVYNEDSDTITVNRINIKIRDYDGLDDGLDLGERPSSLSNEHAYNLENQGWTNDNVRVSRSDKKDAEDPKGRNARPVSYFRASIGRYPSNGEVWWQFKNGYELMSGTWIRRFGIGASLNAKGSKILDAFNQQRSVDRFGGAIVDTKTSEGFRPNCCAFYAGRVWFSGPPFGDFKSNVYYSRLVQTEKDYSQCHPSNDPTSELVPDLLADDGGYLKIMDMGEIIFMHPWQNILFLFCTNGVWSVSGADFAGFQADSYQIKKISSVPALTANSFVDVDGIPMWWNLDGIYTINSGGVTGESAVQNISREKINTFYNNITGEAKQYAQGTYNRQSNIVQWVYRNAAVTDVPDDYYQYDRILNLNLNLQNWYPWSMPANNYLMAPITVEGNVITETEKNVVDSSDNNVIDSIGRQVVVNDVILEQDPSITKYLTYSEQVLPGRAEEIVELATNNSNEEEFAFDNKNGYFYHVNGDTLRIYNTDYSGETPVASVNVATLTSETSTFWRISAAPGQDYLLVFPNNSSGTWDDQTIYMVNHDGTLKGSFTLPGTIGSYSTHASYYCYDTGNTWFYIASATVGYFILLDENGKNVGWTDSNAGTLDVIYNNSYSCIGDNDTIWFLHAGGVSGEPRYISCVELSTTGNSQWNERLYDFGATWGSNAYAGGITWWNRKNDLLVLDTEAGGENITRLTASPLQVSLHSEKSLSDYGITDISVTSQKENNGLIMMDNSDYLVLFENGAAAEKIYRIDMQTATLRDNVDVSAYASIQHIYYDADEEMCVFIRENSYNHFLYFEIPVTQGVLTFSEQSSTAIADWDAECEPAYFETGYKIRGQIMLDQQSNYLSVVSRTVDGAGFLVSGRWDWANDTAGSRVTTQQQGYKHKQYQSSSVRKLKIRGTGKVLQFRVDSDDCKPFTIEGWVTYDTAGQTP